MKIKNDIIIFKSTPEMYFKESKGIKTNTVRILNFAEHAEIQKTKLDTIKINKVNTEAGFIRQLKDISYFIPIESKFLYVYIFSW